MDTSPQLLPPGPRRWCWCNPLAASTRKAAGIEGVWLALPPHPPPVLLSWSASLPATVSSTLSSLPPALLACAAGQREPPVPPETYRLCKSLGCPGGSGALAK